MREYKSLNRLVPEYLQLKFVYRNSQYSLRDSINRLALPLPRTNYLKNNFDIAGQFCGTACQLVFDKQNPLTRLNRAARSIF